MFNKDEISALLRRLCAYLSFDKQDEEKVNEVLKQLDENEELKKKESIKTSDIVIFFFTKKFIQTDQFKKDWGKRENKVFLIVLLENMQPSSFNLNEFMVYDSTNSIVSAVTIKRTKIFLSRLINLKKFNLNNVQSIDDNDLIAKKIKRKQFFLIKKIEFLENDKVIVQGFLATNVIVGREIDVIDMKMAKTISKIKEWEQEFCWINHLNQILIYQKSESSLCEEAMISLFTKEGILIKSVYSLNINQYKVNSISYNKENFEVYLSVFDKVSSNLSILVLNKDFNLINTIKGDITNPDFPLNYVSEIEIFNIRYNIFHYNSSIAFLQEKCSDEICFSMNGVKIFDKTSYSIVGVIKTNNRLVTIFNDKMLFIKYYDFNFKTYLVQNIPDLSLSLREGGVEFCKLNQYGKPHLLTNPYLLPCGNVACLDCIHRHYNIFKRSFQCIKCNQEHKNLVNEGMNTEIKENELLNSGLNEKYDYDNDVNYENEETIESLIEKIRLELY